jgi:hypothetical protein
MSRPSKSEASQGGSWRIYSLNVSGAGWETVMGWLSYMACSHNGDRDGCQCIIGCPVNYFGIVKYVCVKMKGRCMNKDDIVVKAVSTSKQACECGNDSIIT